MLHSLTVQALRHRRGQAVVLVLLSALITGAAMIGPLYERAVEKDVLARTLDNAPVSATGISMHDIARLGEAGPSDLVPADVRTLFGAPVQGSDGMVGLVGRQGTTDVRLASRAGLCSHLTFTEGACPQTDDEVAISAATARAQGLHAGGDVNLSITVRAVGAHQPVPLRISGIYASFDPHTAYWFDHPYVADGRAAGQTDAVFTGDAALKGVAARIIAANSADVPLDAFDDLPLLTRRVTLDRTPALNRAVQATVGDFENGGSRADTSLDALLSSFAADRHQVRQVVPLFAGELVLLALTLLLFVVAAAAAGRRPEVALARLRGQGRTTATRPLVAELSSSVLLGVPLGLLLGLAGMVVAGHTWLPSSGGLALPWTSVVALAAALVAQLAVVVGVAQRLAREPVVTLLRRVPVRRSAVRLGQVEIGVAVLAMAAVLTVLTSGLSGPVALLAPGLLALSIGLLLGAAGPVVAGRIGARALAAGRVRTGLAALQLARRPGARGVLVVLVIASAVLVAAADTWHVAAANRSARAQLETGAPAVLTTGAGSAKALLAATHQLDPTERQMLPVVLVAPTNLGVTVLATHPMPAAAMARWGWPQGRPTTAMLARLDPRLPASITLTGSRVDVRLGSVTIRGGEPSDLYLDVVSSDGVPGSYDLGPLPRRSGPVDLHQSIMCEKGCRWQGFSVVRALTDTAGQYGRIDVDSVAVSGSQPVTIGGASPWHSSTPAGTSAQVRALTDGLTHAPVVASGQLPPDTLLHLDPLAGDGFTIRFFDTGDKVSVQHDDVPPAIPAMTTRPATGSTPTVTFDGGRLDGAEQLFLRVGTVPVMPGVTGNAALADIDIVARLADKPVSATTYQVWLADSSPGNIARERSALGRLGVPVYGVRTIAGRESSLAATGSVLSLQVGLVSGVIGILVAVGVLLITTITTLRSRRYDVAALELSGISRRTTQAALVGEAVTLSVAGTVVGMLCGVAGGRLLLRAAPFLTGGSAFPAHRTFTAWWVAGTVLAATLAVLVAVSWVIGLAVARSATPDVVRGEIG